MATESLGFDRIRRRSKRGEFDGYEIALVDLLKQDYRQCRPPDGCTGKSLNGLGASQPAKGHKAKKRHRIAEC
jgi:hypothetical protein